MARYVATIATPRPIDDVFAYLSDFSTAGEKLDDGPVEVGTSFRITAKFAGSETELIYKTTALDAPKRVVFEGENDAARSVDEITFEEVDGRTRVTYDANLTFKGALRLADPIIKLIFDRVGDKAADGMAEELGGERVG